ncbi:Inhibitor of vertebrate c-type lysozyme, outer membrane [Cupriavidus necator H850]|nr:Inhibitor of vertebrate c-type lysozyme, outer membrane [Cupriavidus necator H850]
MTTRPILSCARAVALLATVGACAAAHAARAPGIEGVRFPDVRTVRYQCDGGKTLSVRYFNSPDNQAAVFRIEGKPVLAVSTGLPPARVMSAAATNGGPRARKARCAT